MSRPTWAECRSALACVAHPDPHRRAALGHRETHLGERRQPERRRRVVRKAETLFRRGQRTVELPVAKIGRASCRERVWQYVEISVVAVSLKKKKHNRP